MTDALSALRAAAEIGPYFSVDLRPEGPGWRRYGDLAGDPATLRGLVAAARATLADRCRLDPAAIDGRAAASIQVLGTVARIVAPALGAAILAGTVPWLAPDLLRWRASEAGPVTVGVRDPWGTPAGSPAATARLLYDRVVSTAVTPLVEVARAEFRLSPRVLWGNVASALAGAATVLGNARPEVASRAVDVTEQMLHCGELRDRGRYVRPWPEHPRRFFVRDNCCLFYRIPGGGTCADCVLVPEATRQAMWRDGPS